MALYRHEMVMPLGMEMRSVIVEDDPQRHRRAFVDADALECLERLVAGGIRGKEDLAGAEIAIRAMVFHDTVHEIVPSIGNTILNDWSSPPFDMTQPLRDSALPNVERLFPRFDFQRILLKVDRVLTINDDGLAQKIIDDLERQKAQEEERSRKWREMGLPEPILDFNAASGQIVKICDGIDKHYSDIFLSNDGMVNKFLREVPVTGSPAYFQNARYKNKLKFFPPSARAIKFFEAIDERWSKDAFPELDYEISIPVSFLTSIVLSRTKSREDIPDEISLLREEFAAARNNLWNLFDEVFQRSYTQEQRVRSMRYIQDAASSVVPAALNAHEMWIKLEVSFFKRMLSFEAFSSAEGFEKFIKDNRDVNSKALHMVDMARVIADQLMEVQDMERVLGSLLSQSEIDALADGMR